MEIISKVLLIIVMLHWSIITGFILLGLFGCIFYKKTKKSKYLSKNIEIVIVSKASNCVKNTLFECIRYHGKRFSKIPIKLVVDEEAELNGDLSKLCKEYSIKMIVVPSLFKCRAIAKGRAIEYFIRNHTERENWYAFIDDDNRILNYNFLREIPYYDKNGFRLANAILKPRRGKSKITYIADHIRYFDDYFLFRLFTGFYRSPINGVHGELLLAKGDILQDVGFDRKTITEDFAFARECIKRGVKTWQSETIMSILSPHSISDFIRQRNRWYKGLKEDVKGSPLFMRWLVKVRLFDWKYGIIGSWLFFPLWFFIGVPYYAILFNLIGAMYYYCAYAMGIGNAIEKPSDIKFLLLMPIYAVIENIAPWYKNKNKGFHVINK